MIDNLVNRKSTRGNPETATDLSDVAANEVPAPAKRRRMSVEDRERYIVDGAITFFSEHGFDAQMRELATAIGVTHALVYHYFPTKQALIDRVYMEVFVGRWKPEWEDLLNAKSLSAEEKLIQFYVDYARTVLTREFVRILIFSGLTDRSITDRFFKMLGDKLFPRIIRETRRHRGCKSRSKTTVREHELLMGLHGGIFYGGLRRFVYGQAMHDDSPAMDDETIIADRVRSYLQASLELEPRASEDT